MLSPLPIVVWGLFLDHEEGARLLFFFCLEVLLGSASTFGVVC